MAKTLPKLLVVAHVNLGRSLSGGDRIFLNLIKNWHRRFRISVLGAPETKNLLSRHHINSRFIATDKSFSPVRHLTTFNLFWHHALRFLSGFFFCLGHRELFMNSDYIYTSSDFYGDFVFGLMAKIFNPRIVWLCGFYLLAPFPTAKDSPYIVNRHYLRGLIYYLAQLPTKLLARKSADFVFVTSTPDLSVFPGKSLVVQGGVMIPSRSSLAKMKPPSSRKYDAFYLGRLHVQKGVLELIDIWKLVTARLPQASLVMVGDGELMPEIKAKIRDLGLQRNITLIGFLVGPEKFKLIRDSRIVVHPAIFDSGGMAAAEAMAWGLPGVSFDLPALKTYYPIGMVKTTPGNLQEFADNIIKLLTDRSFYHRNSLCARSLTVKSWGWPQRFANIYNKICRINDQGSTDKSSQLRPAAE